MWGQTAVLATLLFPLLALSTQRRRPQHLQPHQPSEPRCYGRCHWPPTGTECRLTAPLAFFVDSLLISACLRFGFLRTSGSTCAWHVLLAGLLSESHRPWYWLGLFLHSSRKPFSLLSPWLWQPHFLQ